MVGRTLRRALRRTGMFVLALVLVGVLWETWKALGPDAGGAVFGWQIIPKTNDRVMPHTWEMLAEFGQPEVRDTPLVWQAVAGYAWYTFRLAVVGLIAGAAFGIALATLMTRFRILERGLLPYVVASQTVPLIALAPQIATIAGNWDLPKWTWVSLLGAFLAFFPVTVATLRGLQSVPEAPLELMQSYAAGWWTTLVKLRFPTAMPAIVPGLKLAATASVIGVIVAEISTGLSGGIGKAALTYSQKATSEPAQVYTAVIGAAVLGLVLFAVVVLFEMTVMRNRPKEVSA